jgi:NIMA (never in mitosis gene a)-related kinase
MKTSEEHLTVSNESKPITTIQKLIRIQTFIRFGMQKYEFVRELGSGSFGKVILVRNKRGGEQLAMKEIQLTSLSPDAREKALQEVQLLRSLDHPNIVRLRDSVQEKGVLYIIMEYVDGGDLAEKIRQRSGKPFSEDEVLNIFVQLVLALQHIHEKKIVHRDIKPQNVFLTRVGVVKLGDFGVARALNGTLDLCQTVIGTPYYLSPEVWSNQPYNGQTDLWSLGCILYELCALRRPFTGRDAGQLFAQVMRGTFDPIPSRYGKNIKTLLEGMLNTTAAQRPSANDILQLPFVQTKIAAKIRENEAQLKTVNIIASEFQNAARQQQQPIRRSVAKKPNQQKLPKLQTQKRAEIDLPLPPDEDPPRWAARGSNPSRPNEIAVPPTSAEGPNEYADLMEATARLHSSLKGEVEVDEARVAELRSGIIAKLGDQLFAMLYRNIQQEDDPNCAQFVDIMTESDPDLVEGMRELIAMENVPS